MAQVRALCTLIPAVGKLFGMLIDDVLLPWYVLFPPLPSQLPARLQPLQFALGHVPALSPIRVLELVVVAGALVHGSCVYACLCCSGTGDATKKSQNQEWPFPSFSLLQLFMYLDGSAMHVRCRCAVRCTARVCGRSAAVLSVRFVCAGIDEKCSALVCPQNFLRLRRW